MKKILLCVLTAVLLLSASAGCGDISGQSPSGNQSTPWNSGESENKNEADFTQSDADMFSDRDIKADYDEGKCIKIELGGTSVASSSSTVKIDGTRVTLTEDTSYIISGTLDDGQIIVNVSDTAKIQLVFDNAHITCASSSPIYIISGDKVVVTLVGENSLANGGTFEAIDENNIDGAVYSKQDLTFNGSGSLNITSPAGHGIVCKDDLVLIGGTYTVNAASHALDANDSIRIKNINLTADVGKDGLHAENNDNSDKGFIYVSGGTLNITAQGDGISASHYLHIENGTFDILAGNGNENGDKHSSDSWGGFPGGGGNRPGGRAAASSSEDASTSMKGLKAETGVLITNGEFKIDSADDAIHSNTSLTVNGGSFVIASGDDAIHAEEHLTVSGGEINISTSYEGLEALHIYVKGGNIKLVATDDGLNAAGGKDSSGSGGRDNMFGGGWGSGNSNGSIKISDGTLYINSSGDGIDANGTLEITGGHTTIVGPITGDTTTLDYDKTGTITGGTFIGTGSSMMAQSFSDSSQGVIALSVGTMSAGTNITLKDNDGNVIVFHSPELPFQIIIISTPTMVSGEKYTVTVGSKTGEFEAK